MKNFGKELRRARGKLKRKDAAQILGVSIGALDKWETGQRNPRSYALPELERRMKKLELAERQLAA